MVASVFSGHTTLADILFLIAGILAVVNAFATYGQRVIPSGVSAAFLSLSIALIAVGLLVL